MMMDGHTYCALVTRIPQLTDEGIGVLMEQLLGIVHSYGGQSSDSLFALLKLPNDDGSSLQRIEKGYLVVSDMVQGLISTKYRTTDETEYRR